MARRIQFCGEKQIEADNGFGWYRDAESGKYVMVVFGISYKLEKRRRSPGDTPDTGWYLYTTNTTGFFGEWCASTLLPAVDEASKMIAKADLRGPGYEKKTE